MAHDNYFLEAVVGFCGTSDTSDPVYQEAILVLEGKSNEKQEYIESMLKDIEKWSGSAKNRNQEIYDTAGDITRFSPDLKEVMTALSGNDSGVGGSMGGAVVAIAGGGGGSITGSRLSEKLTKIRGLYTHFLMHKSLYVNAFKSDNKTVKTVYVCGTWLIISYLAGLCVWTMSGKSRSDPDLKYGKMINDLRKVISHPKYTEYMGVAEKTAFNTESILFEGALAIGATLVSMIVALRLIIWNIYMMRTKLSDKLKVTAEFLEKNAGRLKNTNKKDKDKIAAKQLKAAGLLNKVADKVRIKMDDEEPSKPPTPSKPSPGNDKSEPNGNKPADDEDDDIEL